MERIRGTLQLKVCGMREAANIRAVEERLVAACDAAGSPGVSLWMGFIFYPRSPRFVKDVPAYLPERMGRVGVFVDASPDEIARRAMDFRLDAVQLHGHESPDFCGEVRRGLLRTTGREVAIFKAFPIAAREDLLATKRYDGFCDLKIFDAKCAGYGGSGRTFDWEILAGYAGDTSFLLSGGLGMQCLEELKQLELPKLAGYDLNSRFETVPGLKDPDLLEGFVHGLLLGKGKRNYL